MAPTDIHSELQEMARMLRPKGKPFISVLNVAHELGVSVSIHLHTATSCPDAQINLGVRPPKIVLYRLSKAEGEREVLLGEDNLLTPRERFSIAHELGHWIIFSRFQIGPQSDKRMYWAQERVINSFAGSLLVPDWLVERWLAETSEGAPVSPFALKYWAASQCNSSEEVVAKALARCRRSIGFLKLVPATRRKDGARILKVLCSAAGQDLRFPNEGSYIDGPELCELLKAKRAGSARLLQLRLGRCEPQDLQIAWRRGKALRLEEIVWLSASVEGKNPRPETCRLQIPLEAPEGSGRELLPQTRVSQSP